MNYINFKKLKEKPTGLTCSEIPDYPLEFDDDLIHRLDDFPSLSDFLEDNNLENFEEDFLSKYPNYETLACVDIEFCFDNNPDFQPDSYSEFMLFVDKTDEKFPVLYLDDDSDGDEVLSILYPTFEGFYNSLTEFNK